MAAPPFVPLRRPTSRAPTSRPTTFPRRGGPTVRGTWRAASRWPRSSATRVRTRATGFSWPSASATVCSCNRPRTPTTPSRAASGRAAAGVPVRSGPGHPRPHRRLHHLGLPGPVAPRGARRPAAAAVRGRPLVSHHYREARAIADGVPEATLRKSHQQVLAEYPTRGGSCSALTARRCRRCGDRWRHRRCECGVRAGRGRPAGRAARAGGAARPSHHRPVRRRLPRELRPSCGQRRSPRPAGSTTTARPIALAPHRSSRRARRSGSPRPRSSPTWRACVAEVPTLQTISPSDAVDRCPVLRLDRLAGAAVEPDASDIDVLALHQGYVRGLGEAGGTVVRSARVTALEAWRRRLARPLGRRRADRDGGGAGRGRVG